MKNQKKLVAFLLLLAFSISIIGFASVAYAKVWTSPNTDCPRCGSSNTGEASIEGHRYMGKCKDCGCEFHYGGHTHAECIR